MPLPTEFIGERIDGRGALPRVTIVVVPRERFSFAVESLKSVFDNADLPFSLVYIDGRSPSDVGRLVRRQCESRGHKYLRFEDYLSPNEARNIALKHVVTEFVVFVDNDLFVHPGWLAKLVQCADETGAWLVGPLYLEGAANNPKVHMAGGFARIETREGRRRIVEGHWHPHKRLDDLAEPLRRAETQLIEFHCVLARMDVFRQLGVLDERLLSFHEHVDLCLNVRAAGGTVAFEPEARVRYSFDGKLRPADLTYLALRWSEQWNLQSIVAFNEKWGIADDDPSINAGLRYARNHRRMIIGQFVPKRLRHSRLGPRAIELLDKLGLWVATRRRKEATSGGGRCMTPVDPGRVLVEVADVP